MEGAKQRKVEGDIAMNPIEVLEERIGSVSTREGDMPMILCDETIDISYLSSEVAPLIADALERTKIGGVRDHLLQELIESMLMELSEEEKDIGESLFVFESSMGLQAADWEDYWIRDEEAATSIRIIVVP